MHIAIQSSIHKERCISPPWVASIAIWVSCRIKTNLFETIVSNVQILGDFLFLSEVIPLMFSSPNLPNLICNDSKLFSINDDVFDIKSFLLLISSDKVLISRCDDEVNHK